jgi:hypothetical protein
MDDFGDVPGARDVRDVLSSDPLARLAGAHMDRPLIVGALIALLIVATIVFGPASDSRFIYTDF